MGCLFIDMCESEWLLGKWNGKLDFSEAVYWRVNLNMLKVYFKSAAGFKGGLSPQNEANLLFCKKNKVELNDSVFKEKDSWLLWGGDEVSKVLTWVTV